MNPVTDLIPPRLAALEQPRPTLAVRAEDAALTSGEARAIGELLAGLLYDESTLYAITREWRYDTAGRRFLRLHALLDEQFSEIGIRLTRLAARSRDLGSWNSTDHSEHAAQPRAAAASGAFQAYMIRELLRLHEMLIARLKRGSAVVSARFQDRKTTDLLADLTANHEKDAFMLRALLWEVENLAP
jgi:starvation-inducible DNA-binding protein